MPLDTLPVPDVTLVDGDKGTIFKTKMNTLAAAMKSAIQAFNTQIAAGNVAENSAVVAGEHKDAAAASATTAGQHKDSAAQSMTTAGQHKDAAAVSATTAGQHKDAAQSAATTTAQLKVAAETANTQAQQAAAIAVQYPADGQLAAAIALREQFFRKCTLDLNFAENRYRVYEQYGLADKVITDALTVVRASEATYQGPATLATASANQPRITFDPVSGDVRGLIAERLRINQLLNSQYTGAAGEVAPTNWMAGQTTGVTTTTASNRFSGATRITNTGSAQREYITEIVTLAANTTYTLSCYFAAGTVADNNIMRVTSSDTISGSTLLAGSAVSTEGRYGFTFTTTAGGNYSVNIGLGCSASASGTVIHETPMLEASSFIGSYIPTTTSQMTRFAEDISRALNITPQQEATLYCEFMCLGLSNDGLRKSIIKLNNSANSGGRGFGIELSSTNEIQVLLRDGAVSNSITTSTIAASGMYYKVAVRFNSLTNTLSICINGGSVSTVSALAKPTSFLSHLIFQGGNSFTGALAGNPTHFRRTALSLRAVTDAEVQAITRQ